MNSAPPVYPASDLDRADRLLAAIGSFWSETYAGSGLVGSVLDARARLAAQTHLDMMELVASLSRFTVPIWHTRNWYPLALRASARGAGAAGPAYGGGAAYDAAHAYGAAESAAYRWALPDRLTAAAALLNRVSDASLVWTEGIDYAIDRGTITFARDPFASPLIAQRDLVAADGTVVDRELTLWAYRGRFDRDTVYRQFGYVLRRKLRSGAAYRDLVNALFDGLVRGPAQASVEAALAALCDVPLAREPVEVVERVVRDGRALRVVTDRHAYAFSPRANPLVAAGDVVRAGDPLVDALRFYELGRGEPPPADVVPVLALGPGLRGSAFHQDLVFANADVPLEVTTDAEGWTRAEFAVSGLPGDVARFWDEVHARGKAAGKTLAMCLDRREAPAGQPTALALPATVNPLQFLAANLFRDNLTIAVVRPGACGPDAAGLGHAAALRALVPPHAALIVTAQLDLPTEAIILDGPGSDEAPGVEEALTSFLGQSLAESIDPTELIVEQIQARQVRGRCT